MSYNNLHEVLIELPHPWAEAIKALHQGRRTSAFHAMRDALFLARHIPALPIKELLHLEKRLSLLSDTFQSELEFELAHMCLAAAADDDTCRDALLQHLGQNDIIPKE
jgi:hypothetical protein